MTHDQEKIVNKKDKSGVESADMSFKAAIITMLKDLQEKIMLMNEQMDNHSR